MTRTCRSRAPLSVDASVRPSICAQAQTNRHTSARSDPRTTLIGRSEDRAARPAPPRELGRTARWPRGGSALPWCVELAAQVAERGGGARRRLAGEARGVQVAQPCDLLLAARAFAKVLLDKGELIALQGPIDEPWQQNVCHLMRSRDRKSVV